MEILLMIRLQTWIYTILAIVYFITIISCIVVVLSENRNPIKSLAWVTVLFFLPVAGLVFYLFFGRNPKSRHRLSRHNKRKLLHRVAMRTLPAAQLNIDDVNRQIVILSETMSDTPVTVGNDIQVFTEGKDKFESLKRDLREAKWFILLQYYIFTDDKIGHEIADILIEKAKAGVVVKVIYDHVGSFSVSGKFFKRMREAGIDAQPFLRVTFPQLANRINWRNHRKIVVIDGVTGYIGGMNIADRYVEPQGNKPPWRDTHFRIRGASVSTLLYSFTSDWSFMGRPLPRQEINFTPENIDNDTAVQLLTSGPDSKWPAIALTYQKAISSARKRLYIQTPYFLPTDALLKELQSAALAKVDVRIMMPRFSDSRLLNLASYSYITECLRSGIKVYFYETGMIHSKVMIVDDELTVGGSANFDFRSFEHNFESTLLIFDRTLNQHMRDIFFSDLQHCTKLTYKTWRSRPLPQRALESILRLFSPIL